MVAENGESETAEGYVGRDFCCGKGAATVICQDWRGRGTGGGI